MENKESFLTSSDEGDSTQPTPVVRLTTTEPYPGPSLIESATQLVKNWVRQGYNDLIAGIAVEWMGQGWKGSEWKGTGWKEKGFALTKL